MNSHRQVEALLFDLGGVVIDIDFSHAFKYWSNISEYSANEISSIFQMDFEYNQHEKGEIGIEEYILHLRKLLKLTGTNHEIIFGWNSIFNGEISETLEVIEKAKSQFPCYAFSNTNPTHHKSWSDSYPNVENAFEKIFISSDLGLRKPDIEAFSAISDELGIDISNIVFFDDLEENIVGAANSGMQTVHVSSPADVKNMLIKLGVI